ncbi:toxin-antitoxin system HicB family antitoxin [Pseudactinotalea sp. Z1732]|uniref:toxin-antitoxin system HicB family antitoxin n=1 Tax=Micrococcales TaxID=85006 RepID=UPI003C7CF862
MDLDRYLQALQEALGAAAQTSSAEVQEAAERLGRTMESALRLTLTEFAADLSDQITLQLDGDTVEVRFRGGGPDVVVTPGPDVEPPTPPEPPVPPAPAEDGDISRISLRLPESLKSQVEQAAATEGLSTNAWLVRAAQHALHPAPSSTRTTSTGRRMTGWVR